MTSTAAVIGAQFGDEGKGKIVDALAGEFDLVVRFQGGNNAGHTLVVDGRKLVLHALPSGVLHPSARCAIGAGCVVDPRQLAAEMDEVFGLGIALDGRLRLAGNAALILPVHRAVDAARERSRGGGAIGTTLRGIGPAYEDRAARRAVLAQDLRDVDRLAAAVDRTLAVRAGELERLGAPPSDRDENIAYAQAHAARLATLLGDVALEAHDTLASGGRVLYEGAQGVLLDCVWGTLPYVTSSHTGLAGIAGGAGLPPARLGRTVAVVKAYQTRVGGGPFPTEATDGPVLEHLRGKGAEFGATTGRPRRCGWLDLPLLRYAQVLNGFTEIALTKLDVLRGLDPIRICTGYRIDGAVVSRLGPWSHELAAATPVYEDLPGFDDDLQGARSVADLPAAARALIDRVATEAGVPVRLVSTGPGRRQLLHG